MPPSILLSDLHPLKWEVHDIRKDGISSLRIAERHTHSFSKAVSDILDLVISPWAYKKWKATPLDLLSSEGISKERVAELRRALLREWDISNGLRDRYIPLLMQKSPFRGLDNRQYSFNKPGRIDSERALLVILNEIYQLACLWLISDGFFLKSDQLNRVFESTDEFDTHVSRIIWRRSNNPSVNYAGKERRGSEGNDSAKERVNEVYASFVNCLIVRNMLCIHDTLMSQKFHKTSEDVHILMEQLSQYATLRPLQEPGAYFMEVTGPEGFQGTLYIDEKTFDSINLKKWKDRNYRNADAMEDIFRIRFEGKKDDQTNISRAVNFIARVIFDGPVALKEKGDFLDRTLILKRKNLAIKPGHTKSSTVSSLRNATVTGVVEANGKRTESFECQFQYEWEMEEGWKHPAIYDLKKQLTAGARKLGSIDIYNIMFYVRQLPYDKLMLYGRPMTVEDVVYHIFNMDELEKYENPSNTKKDGTSAETIKKQPLSIEEIWGDQAGFLLPVRVGKWIRFITRDSFSTDMFHLYPDINTPAPLVKESAKYILDMIQRTEEVVQIRLEEYHELKNRYEATRTSILDKYSN